MTVENTSKREPIEHVAGLLLEGNDGYITGMEAAGQRQVVMSDLLPTTLLHSTASEFEALGFVFGDIVADDPMFQHVTLPAGWSREGSDHDMWSYIVDERGLRRVGIFYKAAFYDRNAHASITNVGRELASTLVYSGTPILWDLLTTTERIQATEYLRDLIDKAADPVTGDIYAEHGAKARAALDEAGMA